MTGDDKLPSLFSEFSFVVLCLWHLLLCAREVHSDVVLDQFFCQRTESVICICGFDNESAWLYIAYNVSNALSNSALETQLYVLTLYPGHCCNMNFVKLLLKRWRHLHALRLRTMLYFLCNSQFFWYFYDVLNHWWRFLSSYLTFQWRYVGSENPFRIIDILRFESSLNPTYVLLQKHSSTKRSNSSSTTCGTLMINRSISLSSWRTGSTFYYSQFVEIWAANCWYWPEYFTYNRWLWKRLDRLACSNCCWTHNAHLQAIFQCSL